MMLNYISNTRRPTRWSFLTVLVLCLASISGIAQDEESPVVVEIVLEGNVRINPSLIMDNLMTREGEPYEDELARDDVDMLFERFNLTASYILEEVSGGVRVILKLREELRIRKIEIRGLGTTDREKIEKKLGLKEGVFPNRYMLKSLSIKAREHFRDQGYYFAEVNTVLEPLEDGVLLIFNVYKGDKVIVEEIFFHGITEVDEDELHDQLEGTEPVLWIFTDKLKDDVLQKDLAKLNGYLMEEGYLDGRVTLDALDFNDDFDEVSIHYRVQEGKRYTVNSVGVEGCEAFFPDQIREMIRIQPGDPFRTIKIDADIRRIERFYKDRGYFRARIPPPERRYHEDRSAVDLVYRIVENEQKSIRDVVISGNTLTKDKVIRREFTLNPGDILDHGELRWSINKLIGLQYFADDRGSPHVEVTPRVTDDPQLEDIVVKVQEGRSGLFTFNVGVSSDTGLLGGIQINKQNFDLFDSPSSLWAFPQEFFGNHMAYHGGGQSLRIFAMPGTSESMYGLSFHEPYLWDTEPYPVSFSLDLYRNYSEFPDYDMRNVGVNPVIGKQWTREFYTSFGAKAGQVNIYHVQNDAPFRARESEGRNGYRGLEGSISYQDVDNPRIPTIGYSTFLRYEYLGGIFGSDTEISKAIMGKTMYLPVFETETGLKHVLTLKGTFGWAEEHSSMDEMPIFERFYVGGISGYFPVIGFKYREIGPRESDEAIGGRSALGFQTEYSIPLISEYDREFDVENARLKGIVFFNAAGVGMDFEDADMLHKMRSSAGVGLRLSMPVLGGMPISVYYGVPIRKWPGDERRSFNINISSVF